MKRKKPRKEFRHLPWPKRVPILVSDDLSFNDFDETKEQHPITWWTLKVFDYEAQIRGAVTPEEQIYNLFCAARHEVLKEEMGLSPQALDEICPAVYHKYFTLVDIADIWNRTLVRLGYDAPVRPRPKAKEPKACGSSQKTSRRKKYNG